MRRRPNWWQPVCSHLLRPSAFAHFAKPEYRYVAAGIVTLLIAFHPALLRAVIDGPADMFLAAFLLMLCLALYDLRARSGTSEVMAVGLALMALAFSHPMGAAFAFAAVPFLAFAVRPMLVANSALNVVVALIFPTLFMIGRLHLCVLDLSRRRLDLLCRPDAKPVDLDCGGGAAVRRRTLRNSGHRCQPRDGRGARGRRRRSLW